MLRVLVTECGGPAGVGIIKSFKAIVDREIEVIGIDCDQNASGRVLVDLFIISPKGSDDSYGEFITEIIATHNIDIVVCAGEHDLYKLSILSHCNKLPATIIVSSPETIKNCQNKWLFYNACKNTFSESLPFTFKGPVISKPIHGSGSRGIKIYQQPDEIYQEYLPGTEYTVDVFCDCQSTPLVIVPRVRMAIKSGISTKCQIIRNHYLEKTVSNLCKHLSIIGACCIQFKEDSTGSPKILEINPRLGGGTSMSLLIGINFAELYCKIHDNHNFTQELIVPNSTSCRTIVRYFNEAII